jgi:glutathione S-transferase
MIELYDYELSGSCYKVRLLLNFLSLEWKPLPVDFVEKEHKTARITDLNPLGELPILQDDELRLRDAQAILVYLAERYDTAHQWYPQTAAQRGLVHQWLAIAGNELMSVSAARLAKALQYPLDLAALQGSARRVLKIMDNHFSANKFFVTDHATIADIACFPYSALAPEAGIDLAGYPHLVEWIVRFRRLQGFSAMPGISALPLHS